MVIKIIWQTANWQFSDRTTGQFACSVTDWPSGTAAVKPSGTAAVRLPNSADYRLPDAATDKQPGTAAAK